MPKMRTFTFFDGDKTETKESTSYKKAVKSYQGSTKSKIVRVEAKKKKGTTTGFFKWKIDGIKQDLTTRTVRRVNNPVDISPDGVCGTMRPVKVIRIERLNLLKAFN